MASKAVIAVIKRADDVALSLVENPAQDYASYLERVGQYRGLKEALDIILNADNEDDIIHTF
jgi:hypothetical protein